MASFGSLLVRRIFSTSAANRQAVETSAFVSTTAGARQEKPSPYTPFVRDLKHQERVEVYTVSHYPCPAAATAAAASSHNTPAALFPFSSEDVSEMPAVAPLSLSSVGALPMKA
eukprot:CAMPEP_0113880718 /NCGR_PEP_ID=MMETSP0780_2-20120614/7947_1 /TAXON_ID=652834 /ORGANISM="Palpitomonas bilix" /LENGTH=113 /DNA_ID=CAMNT_0000867437 /DNA_START=92 /DNA_END=433 /DNA_ORIENTATION=+ /assembly_acc=CAM_ASM_000599